MRKLVYLICLLLSVAVTSCGSKSKSGNENSGPLSQDSIDAHGLQRMQSSKAEAEISFKGKEYHSLVSRTPDESLPHVANDMGDVYVDNKIVLRLTRGGEVIIDKTFTKNSFSSVVDVDFLQKSVLEGIVYDKTIPQGIVFAASVCYPQTDLYVPLSITITPDGGMSIEKVDMIEDTFDGSAPDAPTEETAP